MVPALTQYLPPFCHGGAGCLLPGDPAAPPDYFATDICKPPFLL